MSDLFPVACAVCGRRDSVFGEDHFDAWANAETEKGWQVYRMAGTEHIEIRCPKHWVQGWADKGDRER